MALLGAEAQLGLGDRFVQDVDAGLVRSRGGGIALHLVESSDGLVVGSVGASGFIIHIHRIGDEPYRTGYVVDHGDIGGQGEHDLRLAGLIRRLGAQFGLPMADGIPADRADQTAGQVRQAFHMRGLQSLQRGVSDFDYVTGDGHADRDLAQPVGLTVVGAQLGHRVDADKTVTAPRAAVFRRFEDEGAGSAAGETLVEADRGERVGEQTAHNRNHTVSGVGQFVELFATGPGGAPLQVFDAAFAHIRSFAYNSMSCFIVRGRSASLSQESPFYCSAGRWPSTTGRGPPSRKQLRLPVWQAAPTWSTSTSSASPSQSRDTPLTYCTWPEVSPLRQYS